LGPKLRKGGSSLPRGDPSREKKKKRVAAQGGAYLKEEGGKKTMENKKTFSNQGKKVISGPTELGEMLNIGSCFKKREILYGNSARSTGKGLRPSNFHSHRKKKRTTLKGSEKNWSPARLAAYSRKINPLLRVLGPRQNSKNYRPKEMERGRVREVFFVR